MTARAPEVLDPGRFLGETIRRRNVAGLAFSENRYAAHAMLPAHAHASPYLCLVVEGSYEEHHGQCVRSCQPGELLYHPAGEAHANRFGASGGRCFSFELGTAWNNRLLELTNNTPGAGAQTGEAAVFAGRMYNEFSRNDAASGLAVEGAALSMLAALARACPERTTRSTPRWLQRGIEYLHANFLTCESVVEASVVCGVHPVHFARLFRRHHGCSPASYVRTLRLEWAKEQLRTSEHTLSSIAHTAGFADHSHFSRQFRRAFGVAPSEYRRAP